MGSFSRSWNLVPVGDRRDIAYRTSMHCSMRLATGADGDSIEIRTDQCLRRERHRIDLARAVPQNAAELLQAPYPPPMVLGNVAQVEGRDLGVWGARFT